MPRDISRPYRHGQLATDGASLRGFGDRLEALITDLQFEAALTHDRATGAAMLALAADLRTAAHGPFSAMVAAHDAACDAENIEATYTPDAGVCLALGIEIKAPQTKAQLQAAVDEIASRFKRPEGAPLTLGAGR